MIVESVQEVVDKKMPLTTVGICDLVQSYICSLPTEKQVRIGCDQNRPSIGWRSRFIMRHGLKFLSVRILEQEQTEITPQKVARHFAFMGSLIDPLHIVDPIRIFNIDELGV